VPGALLTRTAIFFRLDAKPMSSSGVAHSLNNSSAFESRLASASQLGGGQ
jgi:hypothetical protein